MPKTLMLRNTWSIACGCTSPPGVPKGMYTLPPLNARAGLGVRRGRFPGATDEGCSGSPHDCVPRPEQRMPTPGMIGVLFEPSLGVHENALPSLSITQRYEVSPGPGASADCGSGIQRFATSLSVRGSPAGGMPAHAFSTLMSERRHFAYSSDMRPFIGTFTNFGSPK